MPPHPSIEPLEARIAPAAAVFELSSLDGFNGFKVSGAGSSVSDAGDVNGDGFDDVIIVGPVSRPASAHIVFGKASGFSANLNLSTLDGSNGFELRGVPSLEYSNFAVSDAGDVNNDGFDDVIIGEQLAAPNGQRSGASYVVFGKASGFAPQLDLATLNGQNGFSLSGAAARDYSGASVSAAGDVNGDGFGDVIVGAPLVAPDQFRLGVSYVVFGKAAGFAADLNLSALDGSNGFKLSGVAALGVGALGLTVSAADVNGDGLHDLIIAGSVSTYVVFGRATGFVANFDLSRLDGSDGFSLSAVALNDGTGRSLSGAGDINGDGFEDLIIGASRASPNAINSGASYVVFGKTSGFPANLSLSALDGSNGFKVSGIGEDDYSGGSVSGAGDVNGDGFDDVIIGASGVHPNGNVAGASFVIFGKAGGFPADVNLSTINGSNGLKIVGVAPYDSSGHSVSTAGDVNGDGVGDVIIGAPGHESGASYVVFGPPLPSVSIGDAITVEGNAGVSPIMFPVTLASPSTQTITVQFSTANGTAIAGSDYTAQSNQTLEFAPGETTKMIAVNVLGDTAVEIEETFLVNLANPTNATLTDAQAVGTIVNDDQVQLLITQSGKRATFADVDGDLVTVTTSKGAFVPQNFVFGQLGELLAIDLGALSSAGGFSGAKITVLAQTGGSGDGLVNVGAFKASGINLTKVTIDGDLGEIDVGAGGAGNVALQKLVANSIRLSAVAVPGAESTVAGTMGIVKIAQDVKGVLNIQGGPGSTGVDVIDTVVIGGNLDGSAGGAVGGLLRTSGGIGSVVVKGHVIGGAEQSGIVLGGTLGSVKIRGDLRSADAARPITISAAGDSTAVNAEDAVALPRLVVDGNVLNAEVLAGYRRDGTPFNPDAGIGNIVVAGNWSASSVAAGVTDATGDGFGRNDTLIAGDTTAALFARIASITIAGTATGSSAPNDHFGISAQQIGRLIAGTNRPAFTAAPDNFLLDPVRGDFRAVDFA